MASTCFICDCSLSCGEMCQLVNTDGWMADQWEYRETWTISYIWIVNACTVVWGSRLRYLWSNSFTFWHEIQSRIDNVAQRVNVSCNCLIVLFDKWRHFFQYVTESVWNVTLVSRYVTDDVSDISITVCYWKCYIMLLSVLQCVNVYLIPKGVTLCA
jgi:hypothetical protein